MSAPDAVTLVRGADRLTVTVDGVLLTATRPDGTEAIRFLAGTEQDAQDRRAYYLRRLERTGWGIVRSEEMR